MSPGPTRTPQENPPEGDPGTVERELKRQTPKGDPPSKEPKVREPGKRPSDRHGPEHKARAAGPRERPDPRVNEPTAPRDGGGPPPDSPTGRTPDTRRRDIERGGIGRSDPSRQDRPENHESRDERPHAPSAAPRPEAPHYDGPKRRPVTPVGQTDKPFC